jgi:hypothetical protein
LETEYLGKCRPTLVGRGAEFPGRKLPLEFNKITYLIAIA